MRSVTCFLTVPLLSLLLLTGCANRPATPIETPEAAIDTAFTAIQQLDLETFNACSNNHVNGTYHLFDELMHERQKDDVQKLAQAMVENLSWEIETIQINGNTATANVILQNKDFSNAMGNFVADLINHINDSQKDGVNLYKLVAQTIDETRNSPETLLPYLHDCQNTMTLKLPVTLEKVNGSWQVQLNDVLCNALTGNMGGEQLSEEVAERIASAEQLLNNNLERWGVTIEQQSTTWANQVEETLHMIFH